MAAIVTAAVLAVLQAVDGVALKHTVDSLATVAADLQAPAFHDAEIVRWIEWSMAGYYRIVFGLTLALLGLAVTRSRALPRWTAVPALVAAVAFVVDGITVSNLGFAGTNVASLTSWATLALLAAVTTGAAWWRRRRQYPIAALSDLEGLTAHPRRTTCQTEQPTSPHDSTTPSSQSAGPRCRGPPPPARAWRLGRSPIGRVGGRGAAGRCGARGARRRS